ncbi:4-(cytidine 5'-diphospho)-2-C-methyl-D-erythritol kinase [Profundibacterium mesophilum]|uniref:4-(cytidine 5'-diphospho)-2-C-methyl-D-erythritol kinase n=1 Tax=Profundibacterium mesophilum TaxID=1258573 RepID=UPI00191583C9|nr:4-(cytidine 5'-diphospho)-2-C-methyl-D-erythritol kinase [Profundibacterium mesophilum]
MTERAPAKINLALHVTGRRADGYHLLDSLVIFAGPGDTVTARPAKEWSLSVTGPRAAGIPAGEENLVLRAARLMGGPPAHLTLDKHLPASAGIGGGSADAAAALRALARLTGRPIPADLQALGADLPVCMASLPARMRGIGERLDPFAVPALELCLVNPGIPLSTPRVFAALERRDGGALPDHLPDFGDAAALAAFLARDTRNDLEAPARQMAPVIGDALDALRAARGCLLARMSGSGATCFGLFANAGACADAAGAITRKHPGWWTAALR